MTDAEFQVELDKFIEAYQALYKAYYISNYPTLEVPTIFRDGGNTFQRISRNDGSQTSVVCFVALTDGRNKAQGAWRRGDIFKPGGYKAPQPNGKRGNIHEDPFARVPTGQVPSWYA